MKKINDGKENEETVTNLLVKFFEYYAYFFDSKQKISIHKELIESIKKKRKEFYEKIQNAAKTNREKLINDVKNMLAPYIEDKSANFVSALQAHESNDNKHLSIYKDVENTKSKYDGRHYKDMKEVAQSKGGRGGFPGAAF